MLENGQVEHRGRHIKIIGGGQLAGGHGERGSASL